MLRKYLLAILPAVVTALIPCLTTPAGAFELFPRPEGQYTVQRGDTLYGIAGHYYTNPALWPFLWNQNPAVRLKGTGTAAEKQPLIPGTTVDLYHQRYSAPVVNQFYSPPTGIPFEAQFVITRVPFKGIPYDKKYFRYKLTLRPNQVWGYIVASPEGTKVHFLERDLLYIRFRPSKKQAILVGDRFGVYRDRGPVTHPLNPNRQIGFFSEVIGEVEITSTGHDLITAIVLDSYEEIKKGDRISLFAPKNREIVPTKTHRMLTGTILRSATRDVDTFYKDVHNLENDIVFIDRGECDGMKEGILVNIYRPALPIADPYFSNRRLVTPDSYLGEGMVLKAFEKNSTLLITRSREEILPGDIIKSVSD
ncbi:MAG: LysM peptidoglycan-binding domain-containing protein [Desulfomonile tiedjei]|nr:LysM peptidoglycan-binding domain-containing protein [Desulfomonile tiedjei]